MSGKLGRSGRRPKPIADLIVTGRFQHSRHAARLAHMAATPEAGRWYPAPEDREALGAAGRQVLDHWLAAYAFSIAEGALLLEAAKAADAMREWRERAMVDGRDQARASRLALAWCRHYVHVVEQLKVRQ